MEWTQIKVSVSSRHYNMKWVDGEIFGNWDTEEATYLPQTAGAKPDSVTFHKDCRKEYCMLGGNWCDNMVTTVGADLLLSSALAGQKGLGLHNGENIGYPQYDDPQSPAPDIGQRIESRWPGTCAIEVSNYPGRCPRTQPVSRRYYRSSSCSSFMK